MTALSIDADSAATIATAGDNLKWMPLRAGRFAHINGCKSFASLDHIDSIGDWFQVIRPYTRPVSTQVIEHLVLRDRTDQELIYNAMSTEEMPFPGFVAIRPDDAISGVVDMSLPQPTPIRASVEESEDADAERDGLRARHGYMVAMLDQKGNA